MRTLGTAPFNSSLPDDVLSIRDLREEGECGAGRI
jgi:hypothetical protein